MSFDEITELASSYPYAGRRTLLAIGHHYSRRHEREVLDLAAIAADVGIDDLTTLSLEPDENPLLREAFAEQYRNLNLDDLAGRSSEDLGSLANGLKGKYFEILVRDRLNSGDSVGGIVLAACPRID